MPRKQEWTVRVINYGNDGPKEGNSNRLRGLWVEQLRYMGFAKELASFEDNPQRQVLEFYAPRGSDSKIWSEQNAARMRSFGIDTAAAPKWDSDRYERGIQPGAEAAHMERFRGKAGL